MAPKKRPYATPNLVQNPGSAMEMSWRKKKKGGKKQQFTASASEYPIPSGGWI
jgi:hypothetical protein